MKLQRPSSLSWKLLAAILPPVLLAVGGLVWFQYVMARRELLSALSKKASSTAVRLASEVDELFDQRRRVPEGVAPLLRELLRAHFRLRAHRLHRRGGRRVTFRPDVVVFMPPGAPHQMMTDSSSMEAVVVFSPPLKLAGRGTDVHRA